MNLRIIVVSQLRRYSRRADLIRRLQKLISVIKTCSVALLIIPAKKASDNTAPVQKLKKQKCRIYQKAELVL